MGSFWGYVLIYIHLSLFVCEMRFSTFSGLLGAPCYNMGIGKLRRVWQFERLFPETMPFILIRSWLTKHFPILCCAFWKQISNKENVIFLTHSPTGCSHSTWSLIQLLHFSKREQCPRLQSISLLSCLFTQKLHFPYIPISFDPWD